jgi:hypothetical protein
MLKISISKVIIMLNKKFNIETSSNEFILFKAPSISTKIFKLPNLYTIVTNKHVYNIGFFKKHKVSYKSIQAINIKKGRFYYQLLIMPSKKNKVIKFSSNKKAVLALFNIISNNLMQPKNANLNNFSMNNIINKNDKKEDKNKDIKSINNLNIPIKNINKKIVLKNDIQNNQNFSNSKILDYNLYNLYISNFNISKKIINNYQYIAFKFKNYFKDQILLQKLYKNSQNSLKTIKTKFKDNKNVLNTINYNQIILKLSNLITKENFNRFNKNLLSITNKSLIKIKDFKYYIITNKILSDKKQLLIIKNNRKFILKTEPYFSIININYLIFNNKDIKNNIEQQDKTKQNKNYLYKMHIFNIRRIRENTKRIDVLDYSEPTYLKEQIDYTDYWFKIK